MKEHEKDLFFIGFISNYGEKIEINNIYYNHTKLAEYILAQDKRPQRKMLNSKHGIAIDFLIYEMGYLKVGNRHKNEVVYSVNKKLTKAVKDEILIYQSLGYKIVEI